MVIKGKFADGSPMMAIPNYARTNRDPAPPPTPAATAVALAPGTRPRREVTSAIWINEA
jgi:uncharacterized protein